MKHILLTLALSVLSILNLRSQELDTEKSTVLVSGTSTLHDWEMQAEQINGLVELDTLANLKFEFQATVDALKSDKSKMNKLAHKTLNKSEFPNITFNGASLNENTGEIFIEGELRISGVTKKIVFASTYKNENGVIHLEGSCPLKMTDFGLTPPSALLGAIKTKDDIQVDFDLYFNL